MSKAKRRPGFLKRAIPWFGTGLLLLYLGWTTDLDTVADSLAEVSLIALLGVALLGTLTTFFTDTWCVQATVRQFVCPIGYRETLPIKATSYFLNVLNYNVALVGMALYLKRSRSVPFWKTLGAMFFLNVMDILALCVMLGIGLLLNWGTDVLDSATLGIAWLIVFGGIAGFALFMVFFRLRLPLPLVRRVYDWQILSPFKTVSVLAIIRFTALRLFFVSQYLVSHVLFMWLFDIDVPLLRVLVYLPIFTFIQIVPISISGLGTTQLVMRKFYAPYVVGIAGSAAAVVDAASTTAILGFLIFRLIVGYLFLGDLSREVIEQAGDLEREDESDASKTA